MKVTFQLRLKQSLRKVFKYFIILSFSSDSRWNCLNNDLRMQKRLCTDRGEEKRELSGQQEVKMSLDRDGGDERKTKKIPTTGEEMKDIHHQYMTRDTMIEEERRGENIMEKKTGSGIRMEEERRIVKEVGRERGVRIKKKRSGALLQHLGVISLPLLGHTEVSFSDLQKVTAEVRSYGILW